MTSSVAENATESQKGQRSAFRLARTAGLVSVVGTAAAALGFFRETSLALRFGATAQMDAYVAANFIPRLVTAIAGGSLIPGFMLIFIRHWESDKSQAWKFASAVLNWTAAVYLACSLVLAATASWWVSSVYPGYDSGTLATTVWISALLLPAAGFVILAGLLTGILNSIGSFGLPAFAPGIASAAVIVGVLAVRGDRALLVASVVTAFSFALQFLVQWPMARRAGARLFRWTFRAEGMREWLALSVPLIAYQAIAFGSAVIESRYASLLQAGTVASLGYAMRLYTVPGTVLAGPLATVAYPELSRHAANKNWNSLRSDLSNTLRMTLFLFVPAAACLVALSYPVTQLAFEHGAFDASATQTTSSALAFYSLGLVPSAIAVVALRGLYAVSDMRSSVWVETVSLALYALIAGWLARNYRVSGLALARSLGFLCTTILLIIVLQRRTQFLNGGRQWIRFVFKTSVPSLVLAAGTYWAVTTARGWLDGASVVERAFFVGVAVSLFGAAYLVLTSMLRLEETGTLISWVKRRVLGSGQVPTGCGR